MKRIGFKSKVCTAREREAMNFVSSETIACKPAEGAIDWFLRWRIVVLETLFDGAFLLKRRSVHIVVEVLN